MERGVSVVVDGTSILDPPKLVIFLDVSADEALRRVKQRGREDELKLLA
ncbi:MAG: hypothetical protein WA131_09695 [Desulfitobacteriaceae bacterium]